MQCKLGNKFSVGYRKLNVMNVSLVLISLALLSSCSSQDQSDQSMVATSTLPSSSASYDQVSKEVGCESHFIDEKKADIFNTRYRNHWMTWSGKVIIADPESVSLDMNGKGIHELQVRFADPKAGYDILIGSTVTVHFLMTGHGGCYLPFSGGYATITK
jgi:major membrane immunogen (membrane-anchored lipoprotein)